MVIFVVIGDGTGSFKTVNLEVFKLKKEKLFVLISITWYTDTLIPEVSYEPNFVGSRNLNLEIFKILRKKVFKPFVPNPALKRVKTGWLLRILLYS